MMSFPDFFEAVHGHTPFPWQKRLAGRLVDGRDWPEAIDLPTASGKTALLDAAVWAMAKQADLPPAERSTPRRLWFVVDRRIVVDEAFQRARRIADALAAAEDGSDGLSGVAEALRRLGGLGPKSAPLAAARLRGGVRKDEGWSESLSQPAILTSTVDQFGSRLLFRPYGHGPLAAPVHAALAGTDSLLILDEAHCAVPLLQTVNAVRLHQSDCWTPEPVAPPLRAVVMSATPPPGLTDVFPAPAERDAALNHPLLEKRIAAAKPAHLVLAATPKKPARGPRPASTLVPEATAEVIAALDAGKRRVAVMLNRVDSATALHDALKPVLKDRAGVFLLTGRMRPVDREELLEKLSPSFASGRSADEPLPDDRPVVLCTTQCLEVGADFSFDALVTENAAIDALRQRFGRLDRLGEETSPPFAAVLAWAPDVPAPDKLDPAAPLDPIYGNAAAATWAFLHGIAQADSDGRPCIDFGIRAFGGLLPHPIDPLLAPTSAAPVLLPAHLDAWAQTGPMPAASPEPAFFLHGCDAATEDTVDVVWRRDLTPAMEGEGTSALATRWRATVEALPPLAGERLPVRRDRLVRWLAGKKPAGEAFDVRGRRGAGAPHGSRRSIASALPPDPRTEAQKPRSARRSAGRPPRRHDRADRRGPRAAGARERHGPRREHRRLCRVAPPRRP